MRSVYINCIFGAKFLKLVVIAATTCCNLTHAFNQVPSRTVSSIWTQSVPLSQRHAYTLSMSLNKNEVNNDVSSPQPSSARASRHSRRRRIDLFKPFRPSTPPTSTTSTQIKASIDGTFALQSTPLQKLQSFLQNLLTHLRTNPVAQWRLAAFTFITSIFTFHRAIDGHLINLWSWLQNDTTSLLPRLFRHDHWEWSVAVWAFFFWIHGFWIADRLVDTAAERGEIHPWKKYRLQDRYEEEKFRRKKARFLQMTQAKEDDSPPSDLEQPPRTRQHKWHLGFWVFELPLYVLPLYIWDVLQPRRAAKIARWSAPTTFQICSDVTCALLLYDIGFFFFHWLFHRVPLLYRFVHAKHHKSTEVRASDIVRLTGIEEVVDVGISILALNHLGAHPVSRTIYNIIITFLLTELHSGFAFPWTPQFVVPFGLSTGSMGHHYHHRYGKHYYQKFFCHVDRLFGFVQKRDGSLKGSTV